MYAGPTIHQPRSCSTTSPEPFRPARRARPRAATGRRGAARTGAGAGRRRHRQDPGDHPPDRPRRRHRASTRPPRCWRVTFTTRAAGEMREPAARRSGRRGCQARTFHSAALRQLRFFWPRVHGARAARARSSPSWRCSRSPRDASGSAPTRRRCATSPARSSGPRSATSAPTTTPRSPAPAAARSSSLDPETVARVFDAYEEVKRGQGRMDMEDVLLFARRAARRGRGGRRAGPPPVQVVRRRRVPGRLARSSTALLDLWLGGRDELCVVGDPAQTIYSFAGADARYLREFTQRKFPVRHERRPGPQLPLDPRGRRRGQPAARRHAQQGRRPASPSGPPAPASRCARPPTRSPRPRRSPTGSTALRASGTPAGRDGRAVPHQRAVRALRGGPHRSRDPLRRPRRRAVLRPSRGAAGDHPRARRRPLGRGVRPVSEAVVAVLSRMG